MKLGIDGVAFQFGHSSIADFWASILPCLAEHADLDILVLDRGGCPQLARGKSIAFPSYKVSNAAADSFLIEAVCKEEQVDVFISTYYTTPVTIPSVLILHAAGLRAPAEVFPARAAQEKEIATSHATFFACDSEQTRTQLTNGWPPEASARAIVLDWAAERKPPARAIDGLFELLVWARQDSDDPSTKLFFEEWQRLRAIQAETDIGERIEVPAQMGSLQVAATMCTLARLLAPLARVSPALQRRIAELERAGVAMWNSNQPPLTSKNI
jgi:hypothetical protein